MKTSVRRFFLREAHLTKDFLENKQLRCKIFTVRYAPQLNNFNDTELCRFVESHHTVEISKKFSRVHDEPCWTVFVTYAVPEKGGAEKKTAESEAEVLAALSDEEKELYGLLRKWRNDVAKEKGYGPYILFTNIQLAHIAKEKPATLEKLMRV